MKRIFLLSAGLAVTVSLWAQKDIDSPADTVYLQYGGTATVHVKKIEPSKPGSPSAYQIRTHETLSLAESDKWLKIEGGYRWVSEEVFDSFKSIEVQKVVFADGFVLPFEGGEMDRSLLLKAPYYAASHGDFYAEEVVPLTRAETRALVGDEAYYLGYRVSKIQAVAGLAKFLAGFSSGFACYLTRDAAIGEKFVPGTGNNVGVIEYKLNPGWYTGTGAAAVTLAYGLSEMFLANASISRLARTFRDYKAPSSSSFVTRSAIGGGLLLAGGAVTFLSYNRIAKNEGWSESYSMVDGMDDPVKTKTYGKKMGAPWLLPAAGALLANFGLTELTTGLTGLSGYSKLRAAGLDRARVQVAPTPYGMGLSMVF